MFADQLAADRIPPIHAIRAEQRPGGSALRNSPLSGRKFRRGHELRIGKGCWECAVGVIDVFVPLSRLLSSQEVDS